MFEQISTCRLHGGLVQSDPNSSYLFSIFSYINKMLFTDLYVCYHIHYYSPTDEILIMRFCTFAFFICCKSVLLWNVESTCVGQHWLWMSGTVRGAEGFSYCSAKLKLVKESAGVHPISAKTQNLLLNFDGHKHVLFKSF